jgi:hypothetical protein
VSQTSRSTPKYQDAPNLSNRPAVAALLRLIPLRDTVALQLLWVRNASLNSTTISPPHRCARPSVSAKFP